MRGILLPRQTYEQPATPMQADYDFTTMTSAEFNQIFTNVNGFILVEGTGVKANSYGKNAAGLKITDDGSQFSKLELYYSGKMVGSAGYLSAINETYQSTTTNDWAQMIMAGWTYDNSNTNWRCVGFGLYNSSSTYAKTGHEYKISMDLTTGEWEMFDNGTSYKTGTLGSSTLSTLRSRTNGDIWFQICSVNSVEIYTAGWKLIA